MADEQPQQQQEQQPISSDPDDDDDATGIIEINTAKLASTVTKANQSSLEEIQESI